MKKIFAILITLVLLGTALVGCSSNVDTVIPETTHEVEATTTAPAL